MKYLKLRNQTGCFCDPETGLVMSGDDVVPYIPPLGRISQRWLSGGGLLIFEVEDDPLEDTSLDVAEEAEIAHRFYTKEEALSMNYFTLQKTARAFGAVVDRKDNKATLIENLMKRQEEIKAQL